MAKTNRDSARSSVIIVQRNNGKGKPNAVLMFGRPLSNQKKRLPRQLPKFDARTTVHKLDGGSEMLTSVTPEMAREMAVQRDTEQ